MAKHEPDLARLAMGIQRARYTLRYSREWRRDAVRQYTGKHLFEEGTRERVPVNLIASYVNIVGEKLVTKNPRVMLSTFKRQYKSTVSAMQSWANKQTEKMHLANTLKRVVLDALFSIGICKVALATPADAASYAWSLSAGQPFCVPIDPDDWVYDIHARDFSEVTFMGHRVRVPLDAVKDSKIYSRERKELSPQEDKIYNAEGDERIQMLGRGYYGMQYDEFEDHVDLWEIYLPRHKLVVTLSDNQVTGATLGGRQGLRDALRVQRWVGPDEGPYAILSGLGGMAPGNAIGKAPIQDLYDLHMSINNIFRKLLRQSEDQKQVGLVPRSATEDGNRVIKANDGELIGVDGDPKSFQMVTFNGPSNELFQFGTQLRQLFSWLAGNLDVQGGLEPQSRTATQDTMLNANASGQTANLQDDVTNLAQTVLRRLCWYWHHDPLSVQESGLTLPGSKVSTLRRVGPQDRQRVPFEDMEIKVDPYSMPHQTPQSRLKALNDVMQGVLTPLMPLLQQQGIQIDVNAYLQKYAQYVDMPDLTDLATIAEPPQQDTGGEQPRMPAQTQRTYTRENVPQRTQKGNDLNLMNSLAGVNPGGNPNKNGQPVGG